MKVKYVKYLLRTRDACPSGLQVNLHKMILLAQMCAALSIFVYVILIILLLLKVIAS